MITLRSLFYASALLVIPQLASAQGQSTAFLSSLTCQASEVHSVFLNAAQSPLSGATSANCAEVAGQFSGSATSSFDAGTVRAASSLSVSNWDFFDGRLLSGAPCDPFCLRQSRAQASASWRDAITVASPSVAFAQLTFELSGSFRGAFNLGTTAPCARMFTAGFLGVTTWAGSFNESLGEFEYQSRVALGDEGTMIHSSTNPNCRGGSSPVTANERSFDRFLFSVFAPVIGGSTNFQYDLVTLGFVDMLSGDIGGVVNATYEGDFGNSAGLVGVTLFDNLGNDVTSSTSYSFVQGTQFYRPNASVPEPPALLLLSSGVLFGVLRHRGRSRRS